MGRVASQEKVILALLAWLLLGCQSGTVRRCAPPSDLATKLAYLRDMNWRDIRLDAMGDWHAEIDKSNATAKSFEARRNGGRSSDFCSCCESLLFAREGASEDYHLESVGLLHAFGAYDEAAAYASHLISAARGDAHFNALSAPANTEVERSLGWTEPGRTTILDVRVFRRGDYWMSNVYWARLY
jgi:hypothetical protein